MNVSSIYYLCNVLKEWKAFCKTHKLFADAISDLLASNMFLQLRVSELENQLNSAISGRKDV